MSNFEDRVKDAAGLEIDGRYKALAKLDPEIAKRYVIGVNPINADRLKSNRPLEGFGGFAPHDVDSVLEAALGPGGKSKISKEDEEATTRFGQGAEWSDSLLGLRVVGLGKLGFY
jgi:hypothetical protein